MQREQSSLLERILGRIAITLIVAYLVAVGLAVAIAPAAIASTQDTPPCDPRPATAAQVLPSGGTSECKTVVIYGLRGYFDFTQSGSVADLVMSVSGHPSKDLESVRYVVTMKRKPLGSKKRWKCYYCSDVTDIFPTYRESEVSLERTNSWTLPRERRDFDYRISVKLILTASDGSYKIRRFKPMMLPVEKFPVPQL